MNPQIDRNGLAQPLVRVTMKDRRELWLCNAYADVHAAILAGDPFGAHAVVAMRPKDITINPAHVATAEDVTDA
jgi:hypothetical protein